MKAAVLFSSGKDSTFALYKAKKQGYEIKCLISLKSENKDSYMFHTPNIDIVKTQVKLMNIPLIFTKTKGEKEKELNDLKKAIKKAKQKYKINAIISGATYSSYQKNRIDKICKSLKLKSITPIWHVNPENYLKTLIKNKFKIIITLIAAEGLGEDDLGKVINEEFIDKLIRLNKQIGINILFEGGEAETLVLDCPIFHKRLIIKETEIKMENEHTGRYIIKKVSLANK